MKRRARKLSVGQAKQQFLTEKDSIVTHLELDCLKPQVGNGCTLEPYPDEQSDVWMFKLKEFLGEH